MARNTHPTKRGPGRKHGEVKHGAAPAIERGAPAGFVQHRNKAANIRREIKAAIGARQFRIQRKMARAMDCADGPNQAPDA